MYLQRKDLLMREKAGLLESETNFGQQRKNWIEPLRSFVLSLKQATDLEKTSNFLEWKKFFQKIGSNPEIKDKTVSIRWANYGISRRKQKRILPCGARRTRRAEQSIPKKLLLVQYIKDSSNAFRHRKRRGNPPAKSGKCGGAAPLTISSFSLTAFNYEFTK